MCWTSIWTLGCSDDGWAGIYLSQRSFRSRLLSVNSAVQEFSGRARDQLILERSSWIILLLESNTAEPTLQNTAQSNEDRNPSPERYGTELECSWKHTRYLCRTSFTNKLYALQPSLTEEAMTEKKVAVAVKNDVKMGVQIPLLQRTICRPNDVV